jgi:vacuolar iron transporter family protein
LTAHDALGAHLRDELGLSEALRARPLQAASTSAITFASGAAVPLLAVVVSPPSQIAPIVAAVALLLLAVLGAIAARTGGAPIVSGALRVLFWGALAMAATAAIGHVFGVAV